MRRSDFWIFILAAIACTFAGCSSAQPSLSPTNAYQAVDFSESFDTEEAHPSGDAASLWPGDSARNLVADHRANRLNDLVTIQILEDASARGSAGTSTKRKSKLGMGVSGLFGFEESLAREMPNLNLDTMVGAQTDNSFDGEGETSRSTRVVATISCTIVELLPNGNMRVRGKRMLQVNGEDQIITLSGIIRPEDIANDNTITSTRIADARVSYQGVGVLADKQKPGWMTRVLDNVWPF